MKTSTTIATIASIFAGVSTACNVSGDYAVTFYGWPDNSPPGAGVAHNCGGRNYKAGGIGTYDDPVTIATAPGELKTCEIVYLPFLTKYGRYEDDCEQCSKLQNAFATTTTPRQLLTDMI